MPYLLLFVIGFIPGLLWLWFFYRKDRIEPEPKGLIVHVFILGMALGLPAAFLELLFAESLLVTVAVAPIIEEALKYAGVRFTVYRRPEFDEPLDGIVYTAAVALGFASVENGLYLLAAYLTAEETVHDMQVLSTFGVVTSIFVIRALLSVPAHVLYSSMWGYALGKAKFMPEDQRAGLLARGLAFGIGSHALFNFFASHLPQAALAEIILVVVLWKVVLRRIDEGLRISPHRSGDPPASEEPRPPDS